MLQFCVASITLPIASMEDDDEKKKCSDRPKVKAMVNGTEVECLMDSGASISVMSEKTLKTVWNQWKFFRLPMPNHLRVTGITGHRIQVVDYVQLELEILGKTIKRPILVVDGLEKTQIVLGWDTIKEEQLVLDGQRGVYFAEKKKTNEWAVAELQLMRRTKIEPRSIKKVTVIARVGDSVVPPGQAGICEASGDSPITMWDCMAETNKYCEITLALINYSDETASLKPGDVVGMMRNADFGGITVTPFDEEEIAGIFGAIGDEPKEPKSGLIKPLKKEDREELISKLHIEAPKEWQQRYQDLILRYHDTLSRNKFDLGWTDVIKHTIYMKDKVPIHTRQFRIPYEHEAVLHEYVDELLRKGAITPSRAPYNSPVFGVAKKPLPDAKPGDPTPLRCVLDYRRINQASMPDKYCMREVRECLDEVGRHNSKVFSAVDLTSGFWQQALAEDSQQYTAFTVPGKGTRYQWTVTPMGLQGSPASFARLMDYVMQGLHSVLTYIDDVLVHSQTHEAHLKHLEAALLRFRKFGMRINVDKTIFGAAEVQYLGYTLHQEGISPSKDKTEVIRNFPPPTNPKKIREFIGVCNYFRGLVKDFSRKAADLIRLTRMSQEWKGGVLPEAAATSFETLKKDLTTEPVVALPRRDKPYILQTDGSAGDAHNPGGLGAVLLQKDDSGKERVIGYASRGLKKHEKNYSAFLLELTAAVFGIEYFDTYLKGRKFTLCTDHKPLEKLSTVHKKTLNRLQQAMLE